MDIYFAVPLAASVRAHQKTGRKTKNNKKILGPFFILGFCIFLQKETRHKYQTGAFYFLTLWNKNKNEGKFIEETRFFPSTAVTFSDVKQRFRCPLFSTWRRNKPTVKTTYCLDTGQILAIQLRNTALKKTIP